MKILKIFGIVVAIHAFAFVLVFANPGCSSTTKAAPGPAASSPPPTRPPALAYNAPGGEAPMIMAVPLMGNESSAAAMGGFDPNAPAIAAAGRYSPTRPGTPAAAAVQTQPVTNVVPATTYTVVSGDSLWTLAKKNHLTTAELSVANNLKTDAMLRPGQKLIIPAKAAPAVPAADGRPTYKVQPGDKLSLIAKRAGTTLVVLKDLNGLKSDTVFAGQDLKLPTGTIMADAAPVDLTTVAAKPSGDSMTHVVKTGENLSTIARKYEVKQSDIAVANNITNPALIKAGMTLIIPGWQAPKSTKLADEPPTMAKVPSAGQDLDAGLKPANTVDIPVIKIEGAPASATKKP